MHLGLNIIFIVTCYPLLFFMYFLMRSAGNKNGYCFGTIINKELRDDETAKIIDEEYRKKLKSSLIVMGLIPIAALLIPYTSIVFTIWMIWILVICFLPMFWYAKANKQMKELKQERDWSQVSETSYADLKIASVQGKVKFTTFLPMLILSTIPMIIAFAVLQEEGYHVYGWLIAIFALCTYLFYICAIWTDKQKITVISEDSTINMNYARAKKQIWKNLWQICAWINTIVTWVMLVFVLKREYFTAGMIGTSIIYCVIIIVAAVWHMKKLSDINRTYEGKRTITDVADDDKNWIYGIIYYNKNDNHLMVENRMGTGTAVNVAKGFGMGTYVVSTLALLCIPIVCVWMIMMEFTPLDAKVVDDVITCQHIGVEYEILLDEIESYEVVKEIPEMIKVSGTGMDNVLSGKFEVYREGVYEVFLNPQNELFIKIVTDDEMYYISGQDDAMTKELIESMERSMEGKVQ